MFRSLGSVLLELLYYSLVMMILWCGFLLLTHFLCHVYPLECDTKYEYLKEMKCCKKCKPGERMDVRCKKDSETVCKECSPDFYMDEFSSEMECKRCSQCTKEHMVYEVKCNQSLDAVCGCESGYKCNGNPCTDCEKIPTTTPPTTPLTVMQAPTFSQDTVWITLSLCCVCILLTCFILISRTTPACGWIMLASAACSWRCKKPSTEFSECTEDEEVPMPVQEVCEHKLWQESV